MKYIILFLFTFICTHSAMATSSNVGIGTASPTAKLDVEGSGGVILNAGNVGIGTATPSYNLDIEQNSSVTVNAQNNSGAGYSQFAAVSSGITTVFASTTGYGAAGTNSNNDFMMKTNNQDRLHITASGNIGIGTTTPSYLLDVKATGGPSGTLAHLGNTLIGPDYNNTACSTVTNDANWAASSFGGLTLCNSGVTYLGATSSQPIYLRTGSNNTMTILGNGNVGIGTTGPTYTLQVNGSVGAGSFWYSSDENLKQDIQPLNTRGAVLDRLDNIHGVYFRWKQSLEKSVGVIAQDVNKDFPELVNTKIEGHWSVQYNGLSAIAIEAIKELKTKVFSFHEDTDKRLVFLEKQNIESQKEIAELKKEVIELQKKLEK